MDIATVHAEAAAGNWTPLVARRIAEAIGADPDAVPIPCEAPGCTAVRPHGEMFSMWVVYGMPGPGKAPYYCAREQHYGCTHDHAKAALLACLEGHIEMGDHG